MSNLKSFEFKHINQKKMTQGNALLIVNALNQRISFGLYV